MRGDVEFCCGMARLASFAVDYIRELRAHVGHRQLLVPSVSAIIMDGDRVLLCRKVRSDTWSLVGGAIDRGETPPQACRREALEETGLVVEPERVVGVFGGPDFFIEYDNGDHVAYISTAFDCRVTGGRLEPDGEEVEELRYFTRSELAATDVNRIASVVLPHVFAGDPRAAFQR